MRRACSSAGLVDEGDYDPSGAAFGFAFCVGGNLLDWAWRFRRWSQTSFGLFDFVDDFGLTWLRHKFLLFNDRLFGAGFYFDTAIVPLAFRVLDFLWGFFRFDFGCATKCRVSLGLKLRE